MTVHVNSIASWRDLDTSERASAILSVYRQSAGPLTDREVAERLGFTDMNAVRPRITELVAAGKLAERDAVKDHITGKTVRACTNTTIA